MDGGAKCDRPAKVVRVIWEGGQCDGATNGTYFIIPILRIIPIDSMPSTNDPQPSDHHHPGPSSTITPGSCPA
jgi:hypothetical protein